MTCTIRVLVLSFVVPSFDPSTYNYGKQSGCALDAPAVWKALSDVTDASLSVVSFRKRLKSYL